ncbi:hypothetical protein GIB67_007357 [Kingdonia uniflora]|uniref:Methyltransferase type 11 domain-containing protein n=1 Tax=Kingdonia uniflora TaxID=39325 RepID=A0A7J7NXA3_9MAGN|nr:hypothetical protein GIB67_007357 [Kingdonia uniflora]
MRGTTMIPNVPIGSAFADEEVSLELLGQLLFRLFLQMHRIYSPIRRYSEKHLNNSYLRMKYMLKDENFAMLNKIHPPRPNWYEEFYALAMEKSMEPYEAEIAGCKAELFASFRGKSKDVLELGIGTGPNLKYYADDVSIRVFGVDPNKSMEKYAKAAAKAAGLPPSHFAFIQGVGESLPVSDSSIDVVIGTLVLCSVEDVKSVLEEVKRVLKPGGLYIFIEHVAAEDGTTLRFIQSALDPLQQIVADGCHLTRETGKYISEAGFSSSNIKREFFSAASLLGPHVYGIASK